MNMISIELILTRKISNKCFKMKIVSLCMWNLKKPAFYLQCTAADTSWGSTGATYGPKSSRARARYQPDAGGPSRRGTASCRASSSLPCPALTSSQGELLSASSIVVYNVLVQIKASLWTFFEEFICKSIMCCDIYSPAFAAFITLHSMCHLGKLKPHFPTENSAIVADIWKENTRCLWNLFRKNKNKPNGKGFCTTYIRI